MTGGRSAAFRFLCRCLSASNRGALEDQLARMARSPAFRWTEFVDLATDQLVAPTVAHRFDRLRLNGVVPEVVERYFSAILRLIRSRNTHLRNEAMEVARALNEIDVVPVFLKGSAGLLAGLYDDPGIRVMSDLDVLVPPDSGDDSVSCLRTLGYFQTDGTRHPRMHSFCTLARVARLAPVDLHREVLAYPHERLLPARDVLIDAVEHRRDGVTFAVPCVTHQIILNVGHAQLNDHGYVLGHLPLRSLHDLALMVQGEQDQIDWKQIENRFLAIGNRKALDFHCFAARELLDAEPEAGSGPSPFTRFLLRRAHFMIDHPGMQRISHRFIRVVLLLKRELSSAELRARLLRNMRDTGWWRRHLAIFLRGGR
jgi:hypothetical protein